MEGGRGNDVYYVNTKADRIVEKGGQGEDTAISSVSLSLGANVENLRLTGGRDLNANGNDLGNVLRGNGGDNKLQGRGGDDHLLGGSGDDVLVGGHGHDRLTGGSGEDVFVFEAGRGIDHVSDFRDGQDKIDVSRLGGVDSLADLALAQMGTNALVCYGMETIVLEGTSIRDLDEGDFIF